MACVGLKFIGCLCIKYKWGPLYKVKFDVKFIVQSTTISMRSMLMLGGSGGMPPQKIL